MHVVATHNTAGYQRGSCPSDAGRPSDTIFYIILYYTILYCDGQTNGFAITISHSVCIGMLMRDNKIVGVDSLVGSRKKTIKF